MTRGGRHFKPPYLEEDYPGSDPPPTKETDKTKVTKEVEEDKILTQLKIKEDKKNIKQINKEHKNLHGLTIYLHPWVVIGGKFH